MSKENNKEDFYIKFDDLEYDEQDHYIKLDGDNIVESGKVNEHAEFLIEGNSQSNNDYIPDYNSPEYAEYISKMNRNGLKEISSDEINGGNITKKIKEEVGRKYNKKQMQIILMSLIGVLFIGVLITTGLMLRGISSDSSNKGPGVNTNAKVEDFDFLMKVTVASGDKSINSYNELKDIAIEKNEVSSDIYNIKIENIKKEAMKDLEDVNSLGEYIKVREYEDMVSLLEMRYDNLIELCDKLMESKGEACISSYNDYAKVEIEIVDTLNQEIAKKLNQFNIPYTIKNGNIVIDN